MNRQFWIVCTACQAEFKDIKVGKKCRNCNASGTLEERYEPELLERISKLVHQMWQSNTQSQFHTMNAFHLEGKTLDDLIHNRDEHWKKNWVEYHELTEEEKEKDRHWAKKIMKTIQEQKPTVSKFEGT